MADMENDDDVPKLMDFNASSHHEDSSATHNHVRLEEESLTRPGAQLDDKQSFTNKSDETVNCYPVIVDFRRLLQLTDDTARTRLNEFGIIPGISNRDLLHAVVGLYDVSLSEMTPDVIYTTVCERWARTVILVRDLKDALLDLESRRQKESAEEKEDKDDDDEDDEADTAGSKGSELSADEDVYEGADEQSSKFCDVYSDTESEEEEEEEDDEEDFSKGINSFIQSVVDRRKARKSCEGPLTEDMVGVENRILGCATFEKKYVKHKDRVIHLTLVSVRRRCRKFGLGKYMLSQIVDPKVVGHYDAVVVHADNEAVDFFQKFGFSDDVVLNSRWKDLAEQFTNCTLMTYLPGFTGHRLLSTIKIPGYEVFELEQEFNKWKEKTVEVYQQQITCMMRFKHEVLQLKYTTAKQSQLLETLLEENEQLKTAKLVAEKEYLDYRLRSVKNTLQQDSTSDETDDIDTQELIDKLQQQVDRMEIKIRHKRLSSQDLEKMLDSPKTNGSCTVVAFTRQTMQSRIRLLLQDSLIWVYTVCPGMELHCLHTDENRYMSFPDSEKKKEEPYDHIKDSAFFYDVTEQFKQQMRLDLTCFVKCEVSTISKALLSDKVRKAHKEKMVSLKDPAMVIDLYYCGTLERPHRIKDILKNGFTEEDFTFGEYGKGLYFSKFPSKAAQFSAPGNLLKVEVGIGHVETVIKPDRTRSAPTHGYDSIIETMAYIRAWMSSKFGQFRSGTIELAALEHLKNRFCPFLVSQLWFYLGNSQIPGRLSHNLGDGDAAMNQEYVIFDVNQVLPLCVLTYETS